MKEEITNIYFPHRANSIGGPSSFQSRLENMLRKNNFKIFYSENKKIKRLSKIIVVNGTGKIIWLLKNKLSGVKIIHRLDGINDYAFCFKDGFKNFIKSQINFLIIFFIKNFLADQIIYQSNYVKNIWKKFTFINKPSNIIYNAVDLKEFRPLSKRKNSNISILLVEGTVQGELAINALKAIKDNKIEVYGIIHKKIKKIFFNKRKYSHIRFFGQIPRKNIPKIFLGKKIYLSTEINPACPNSVIEALASGIPVVGFNSGSLSELVGKAGIILNYIGGNPDRAEGADCKKLNLAIHAIYNNYEKFSNLARKRALEKFNIDYQFKKYLDVINK